MSKIETAAQREEKVRHLSRRITSLCATFYENATEEKKEKLWTLLDDLENAMISYRKYDVPWDSQLIDTIEQIDGIRFKTQTISTFESVMDKLRDVFVFITTP